MSCRKRAAGGSLNEQLAIACEGAIDRHGKFEKPLRGRRDSACENKFNWTRFIGAAKRVPQLPAVVELL